VGGYRHYASLIFPQPGREVLAEGRRIPYDHLIVATGAEHAYFGNDSASYAPGLKTIDDATFVRRRILLAFERAEAEPDPGERRRLLTFVVVGDGPTGVEMAGAIAELAKRALAADFRSIDPRCARIVLVEAGPRLLAPFDPLLSQGARRALQQLGVEVRLGARVTDCDCSSVTLGQERIGTRTIIWGAGVKTSPAAEWLAAESRRPREGQGGSFGAATHRCLRGRRFPPARSAPTASRCQEWRQ
jgi:NADH dehydrogenase